MFFIESERRKVFVCLRFTAFFRQGLIDADGASLGAAIA
jgi:hypothetical protein